MKKILLALILILVASAPAAAEDSWSLGLGGQDGHSDSSKYAIGKGWAGFARYEHYFAQDISMGGVILPYTWEKSRSRELKGEDKLGAFVGIEGTLYLLRIQTISFLVRPGIGVTFREAKSDPALSFGYGFEEEIGQGFSIELCGQHTFSPRERHDFLTAGLKYRF